MVWSGPLPPAMVTRESVCTRSLAKVYSYKLKNNITIKIGIQIYLLYGETELVLELHSRTELLHDVLNIHRPISLTRNQLTQSNK